MCPLHRSPETPPLPAPSPSDPTPQHHQTLPQPQTSLAKQPSKISIFSRIGPLGRTAAALSDIMMAACFACHAPVELLCSELNAMVSLAMYYLAGSRGPLAPNDQGRSQPSSSLGARPSVGNVQLPYQTHSSQQVGKSFLYVDVLVD